MKLKCLRKKSQVARGILAIFYRSKPWRFIRLVGGPLLVIIGLLLRVYPYSLVEDFLISSDLIQTFGFFCIFMGIYSGIRPFLYMLYGIRKFKEHQAEVEWDPQCGVLKLQDYSGQAELKLGKPYIQKVGNWGLILRDKDKPRFALAVARASVIEGDFDLWLTQKL